MNNDLISVIVPVYNSEKYLSKCVVCILEQSYVNFELILVNDGSRDNSLSICKKLSENDRRIVVLNQKNKGASAARNRGLEVAKGEYIVFVDSDDLISNNYLLNLYKSIKLKNFDIIQCNLTVIDDFCYVPKTIEFSKKDVDEISKIQALNERAYKVSVCGKIYNKNIFNNFRFKEGIIYEDDASYYIFVDRANRIGILNEVLYYYYMSPNSVMRNDINDKSTAFIDIYEERIKYFQNRKNKELLDGTYDRYCLVLMLSYANSLVSKTNINNRVEFIQLFKINYKKVMQSRYITIKDKIMFFVFNISPRLVGTIIGRIRS